MSLTKAPTSSPNGLSTNVSTQPETVPFRENIYILSVSALVGILSGLAIVVFKSLIQLIRETCYGDSSGEVLMSAGGGSTLLLPVVGGLGVGVLIWIFGEFAPGLRGTIREVDAVSRSRLVDTTDENVDEVCPTTPAVRSTAQEVARATRKSVGAALTLGTGNRYEHHWTVKERLAHEHSPTLSVWGQKVQLLKLVWQ